MYYLNNRHRVQDTKRNRSIWENPVSFRLLDNKLRLHQTTPRTFIKGTKQAHT